MNNFFAHAVGGTSIFIAGATQALTLSVQAGTSANGSSDWQLGTTYVQSGSYDGRASAFSFAGAGAGVVGAHADASSIGQSTPSFGDTGASSSANAGAHVVDSFTLHYNSTLPVIGLAEIAFGLHGGMTINSGLGLEPIAETSGAASVYGALSVSSSDGSVNFSSSGNAGYSSSSGANYINEPTGGILYLPVSLYGDQTINYQLTASAGSSSFARATGSTSESIASYGSTMYWGGINRIILPDGSTYADGFTALSASGFDYAVSAVSSVPEPETYVLILAGLALVGGVARRGSRQSSGD